MFSSKVEASNCELCWWVPTIPNGWSPHFMINLCLAWRKVALASVQFTFISFHMPHAYRGYGSGSHATWPCDSSPCCWLGLLHELDQFLSIVAGICLCNENAKFSEDLTFLKNLHAFNMMTCQLMQGLFSLWMPIIRTELIDFVCLFKRGYRRLTPNKS